ncbi:MAG: N-acetylmuramoyl-L-alanine amidase [Schwartzia sp.]|nr:N-acetylmuramoyl-L-alanine amidase [Schwartzia sp. (in: firmicutes)]
MEAINITDYGLFFPPERLVMRDRTALAVLHHTGGAPGEDPDVAAIDDAHRGLGWAGVGYHYLIRKSGAVEAGRPALAMGAHAEGANTRSIGIALCGNFCEEEPTAAQIESCAMLIAVISASFGVALDEEHIVGHRDLAATACPGDALYERLEEIIGKAVWYQGE